MTSPETFSVLFNVNGTLGVPGGAEIGALLATGRNLLNAPGLLESSPEGPLIDGHLVSGLSAPGIFERMAGTEFEGVDDELLHVLNQDWAERYRDLMEGKESDGLARPGAESLLEGLSGAGWKMGLLTGSSAEISRLKLHDWGLERFFSFDDMLGFGDRYPSAEEVLGAAVSALEDTTIYVVASAPQDIKLANAAGLYSIGVALGNEHELAAEGADQVVGNLDQVRGILLGS